MKTMPIKPPNNSPASGSVVGATEGARRATGVAPTTGGRQLLPFSPPDPEVPEKKPRRKFTARYKMQILQEADQCTEPGQIGALLRREGLYSSHLTVWRRQRRKGQLEALRPKKRGRKTTPENPLAKQVAQKEKEILRLKHKLKQAETIIEVQKKISEILGISQNQDANERRNS